MTFVLDLKPETVRRIAEKAAVQNVASEEIVVQLVEAAFSQESDEDMQFDASMKNVFTKYHKAFEVLAEGAP